MSLTPKSRFFFFDTRGRELDDRGEVNTGTSSSVVFKGRHCCRFGLMFRTKISGFRGKAITAEDFDGRPVLVKEWHPNKAEISFFWLVPAAGAEDPHRIDVETQGDHLVVRDSKLDARARFHPRQLRDR